MLKFSNSLAGCQTDTAALMLGTCPFRYCGPKWSSCAVTASSQELASPNEASAKDDTCSCLGLLKVTSVLSATACLNRDMLESVSRSLVDMWIGASSTLDSYTRCFTHCVFVCMCSLSTCAKRMLACPIGPHGLDGSTA